MSLLTLKQCLSAHKIVSKDVLQHILCCDVEFIDNLLDYWVRKGKVEECCKPLTEESSTCFACQQGCRQEQVFYTWL